MPNNSNIPVIVNMLADGGDFTESEPDASELHDDFLQTPPLTRGNSAVSSYEDQVQISDGELASSLDALSNLFISEDHVQLSIPGTPPNELDWVADEVLGDDTLIYEEPEDFLPEDLTHSSLEVDLEGPRRRALLIGIKYDRNPRTRKSIRRLKGSHTDVDEVKKLLEGTFGWTKSCFTVLKDDGGQKHLQPTLANMRKELKALVKDTQPGDQLFFYFSGHGTQVKDEDGDEEDGLDEGLVSCDGQMLIDDELHDVLVKPLPAGCRLTALFDCCTSGTGLDLPWNVNPQPVTSPSFLDSIGRKQSDGDVVLLAACEDSARAYEDPDPDDSERRVRGMLTLAFINSFKTRRRHTYNELLSSVTTQLDQREKQQKPQLSSSRELNMDDYFDL